MTAVGHRGGAEKGRVGGGPGEQGRHGGGSRRLLFLLEKGNENKSKVLFAKITFHIKHT